MLEQYLARPQHEAFESLSLIQFHEAYYAPSKPTQRQRDSGVLFEGTNKLLWKRRDKKSRMICRLWSTSPRSGELHYLRLLLGSGLAVRRLEDLLEVDGTTHATFKDAAIARGVVIGTPTEVWRKTMQEAVLGLCSGPQVQALWCSALVEGCDVVTLYHEFSWSMGWELHQEWGGPVGVQARHVLSDFATDRLLEQLWTRIRDMGMDPHQIQGLPAPRRVLEGHDREVDCEVARVDRAAASRRVLRGERMLNDEQRAIYNEIVDAARNRRGLAAFLQAPSA